MKLFVLWLNGVNPPAAGETHSQAPRRLFKLSMMLIVVLKSGQPITPRMWHLTSRMIHLVARGET